MHLVYKTQHIAGMGSAVIIICNGEQDHVRFAEYHIILRNDGGKRISQRLLTDVARDLVTDEDLRNQALTIATGRVQSEVDEHVRSSADAHLIAPAISVIGADDRELRALRFAGVCKQQLAEIATVTLCTEVRDLIRMLRSLPVITVEEL